mmetsp:Transcript_9889/g.23822  ORF Transcript_9889/g.23822 Transcript_9889/m.23822 type:complete len:333 (+) Transcript_9889:2076-3074(+)
MHLVGNTVVRGISVLANVALLAQQLLHRSLCICRPAHDAPWGGDVRLRCLRRLGRLRCRFPCCRRRRNEVQELRHHAGDEEDFDRRRVKHHGQNVAGLLKLVLQGKLGRTRLVGSSIQDLDDILLHVRGLHTTQTTCYFEVGRGLSTVVEASCDGRGQLRAVNEEPQHLCILRVLFGVVHEAHTHVAEAHLCKDVLWSLHGFELRGILELLHTHACSGRRGAAHLPEEGTEEAWPLLLSGLGELKGCEALGGQRLHRQSVFEQLQPPLLVVVQHPFVGKSQPLLVQQPPHEKLTILGFQRLFHKHCGFSQLGGDQQSLQPGVLCSQGLSGLH